MLAATVGGGATVVAAGGGGGVFAGSLLKGGVVKGLLGAALAGVGTAGTIVAVHDFQVGVGSGIDFGGSHQLTSRAPFTPLAPNVTTEPRRDISSTLSYRSTSVSHSAGAVSAYAAPGGGASAHSHTGATATMIAVLHPLSPRGLTSTLIPSPLLSAGAVVRCSLHEPRRPRSAGSVERVEFAVPCSIGIWQRRSGFERRRSFERVQTTSLRRPPRPLSRPPAELAREPPAPPGRPRAALATAAGGGYAVSHSGSGGGSGENSHASSPSSSGSSSSP